MNRHKFFVACERGGKLALFLLFLVLFGYLYLPDMVTKYTKKATTFTTRFTKSNNETYTVTICMDVPLKPSVVNNTLEGKDDYFWRMEHISTKKYNPSELFNKATFSLDRDFSLKYNSKNLKASRAPENQDGVLVEPYNTMTLGKCYAITPPSTKTKKWVLRFEDLENDMPSGIELFITSKNASKNVIWNKWPVIHPLLIHLRRDEPIITKITLRETEWWFHEGNEDCRNGCQPDQCFSWEAFQTKRKGEKKDPTCIPIPLKHFFQFNGTQCTRGKSKEMMTLFRRSMNEKALECRKPRFEKQYHANLMETRDNDINDKEIIFYIIANYDSKTVLEEALIYDNLTFVGTLGGFLGLFVGFSFFGYISDLFLFLLKRSPCAYPNPE